jgi:adenosylhomocysteine nucleosidase
MNASTGNHPSPPPRILVFFALAQEAAPYARKMSGQNACRWVVTGAGPLNARQAAHRSLIDYRPEIAYTCGYAGGLNPILQRNTILFEAAPGFAHQRRLLDLGAVPARFSTTNRIMITAAEKKQLRAETGADAVDMESGVIHEVCAAQRISCATVRIISDTAEEDLPLDFNALLTVQAKPSYVKLAAALLKQPGKLKELIALQTRLKESARLLAGFLARLTA